MKRSALVTLGVGLALGSWPTRALGWEPFRSENREVREGNQQLEKGQLEKALAAYGEAAKRLPNEGGVHLDRGIALLKAGKLPAAREALRMAAQGDATPDVRAKANYNLGLAFMAEADAAAKQEDMENAQKLLRESADAFKSSLRASPKNRDAAWNLELSKRRQVELEKKQQEKKDQDQKKKDEEQKKKDEEKKDDENKDGENKDDQDGENKDGQGDDDTPDAGAPEPAAPDAGAPEQPEAGAGKQPEPEPEPKGGEQKPEPSEAKPEPALPEHMQKALDALENSEENLQKHRAALRARQRPRRVEKDW